MEMLRFSTDERLVAATLLAEIDHHAAKYMREDIDKMLFKLRPDTLILDFSSVKFMDSSGIGLIIGRAELCKSMGCSVELKGLSPSLMRLVRLGGVEKIENVRIG